MGAQSEAKEKTYKKKNRVETNIAPEEVFLPLSGERKLFFQATTDRASFTSVGPSVFTASAATAADGADIESDVVDNGGTKKKKEKSLVV